MLRVERALAAEPGARLALGGGVAANARLRERAAGLGVELKVPPPRALHRQRGDDRLGRPLGRAAALPGLPGPGRLRDAPRRRGVAGDEPWARQSPAPGTGLALVGARRPDRDQRDRRARRRRAGAASRSRRRSSPSRRSTGARRASRRAREQRVLVELPRPALADRDDLDALSPEEQRDYVRSLQREGAALRSALGARGVELRDVVTFGRTWDGFAATVDTSDLAALSSLGVRAQPVRRFYPGDERAGAACRGARRRPRRAPPADQAPIAVLDTGADAPPGSRPRRTGLRRARARRRPGAGQRPARAAAAARRPARRSPGSSRRRVSGCCPCASRASAQAEPGDPRDDRHAAARPRARRRPGRRRRHRRRRARRARRRQRALRRLRRLARGAGGARRGEARHARRRARRQRGPGAAAERRRRLAGGGALGARGGGDRGRRRARAGRGDDRRARARAAPRCSAARRPGRRRWPGPVDAIDAASAARERAAPERPRRARPRGRQPGRPGRRGGGGGRARGAARRAAQARPCR